MEGTHWGERRGGNTLGEKISMLPFLEKKFSPACFPKRGTVLWSQGGCLLGSLIVGYASSSGVPET